MNSMWTIVLLFICFPSCYSHDESGSNFPWTDGSALGSLLSSSFSRLTSEVMSTSSQDKESIPQYYGIRKEDIPFCSNDFAIPQSDFGSTNQFANGPVAAVLASRLSSRQAEATQQTSLFDGSHSMTEILFSLAGDSFRTHHETRDSEDGVKSNPRSVLVDVLVKFMSGSLGNRAHVLDSNLRHLNTHYRSLFCNLTHSVALSTNPRVAYHLTQVLAGVLKQGENFRRLVKELVGDFERTVNKLGDALQMMLDPSSGAQGQFLTQRAFMLVAELFNRIKEKGLKFGAESIKELSALPKFGKVYLVEMLKITVYQVMSQFVAPMPNPALAGGFRPQQ